MQPFYIKTLLLYRGCFKITFSRNLVIEVTQFKNFETSKVTLLKHALTRIKGT